jgi:Spy/CpxP family protein refolding chaperone
MKLIKTIVAVALAGMFAGAAWAQPPQGPGMGPGAGMGPGMMGGYGPGAGQVPGGGYGPGYGRGYGPGYGMGPGMMGGYGPGYGMGPGMMHGYGMGPGMVGGDGPGMMGGYGRGYGMGAGMMGRALWSLDLSDAQRSQIAKIQDEVRRKNWDLLGKTLDERVKLREAYFSGKRDRAAILGAYKRIGELRLQRIENGLDAREQLEGVLTKEQRDELRRWGPWSMMGAER